MFKFLTVIFLSSIALASSNNFMQELHQRISEIERQEFEGFIKKSEAIATKVLALKDDIVATQQRFITYPIINDLLTQKELVETTQYVFTLVEKASQIMAREYLGSPYYTKENFKETYIEFHNIIYKYMEVMFLVSQKLLKSERIFSIEDYYQFIKSIDDRTEPHELSLEENNILRAIQACRSFTNFLDEKKCSVFNVIKVALLNKDNIAQYLKIESFIKNCLQTP